MLELSGYVVKTKASGRLECHYLVGNTIYLESYKENIFKRRTEKVRGKINLAIDSHNVQALSANEWPTPIYNQISPLTMSEGISLITKGSYHSLSEIAELAMEALYARLYTETQFKILRVDVKAIQDVEKAADKELARIRNAYVDEMKRRVVVPLSDSDLALICGLIECSCGKNKLHQSFSDIGLDLDVEHDPDNVTGALKFKGGITLEDAFLNRNKAD